VLRAADTSPPRHAAPRRPRAHDTSPWGVHLGAHCASRACRRAGGLKLAPLRKDRPDLHGVSRCVSLRANVRALLLLGWYHCWNAPNFLTIFSVLLAQRAIRVSRGPSTGSHSPQNIGRNQTDAVRSVVGKRAGAGRKPAPGESFEAARRRKESALADSGSWEFRRRKGELVEVSLTQRTVEVFVRELRGLIPSSSPRRVRCAGGSLHAGPTPAASRRSGAGEPGPPGADEPAGVTLAG